MLARANEFECTLNNNCCFEATGTHRKFEPLVVRYGTFLEVTKAGTFCDFTFDIVQVLLIFEFVGPVKPRAHYTTSTACML